VQQDSNTAMKDMANTLAGFLLQEGKKETTFFCKRVLYAIETHNWDKALLNS
jgi:hypothetical protein